MIRNKYFKIRVNDEELRIINTNGNSNVSKWARGRLLANYKDVFTDKVVDGTIEPYEVQQVSSAKNLNSDGGLVSPKCADCFSVDTKEYDRRGKLFWLCDAHKP